MLFTTTSSPIFFSIPLLFLFVLLICPLLRSLLLFFAPLLLSTAVACLISIRLLGLPWKDQPTGQSAPEPTRKIIINVAEDEEGSFMVGYKWEGQGGRMVEKKLHLVEGNGVITEEGEGEEEDEDTDADDNGEAIDCIAEGMWDCYLGMYSKWHHNK